LQCDAIRIELNLKKVDMAKRRLERDGQLFFKVAAE